MRHTLLPFSTLQQCTLTFVINNMLQKQVFDLAYYSQLATTFWERKRFVDPLMAKKEAEELMETLATVRVQTTVFRLSSNLGRILVTPGHRSGRFRGVCASLRTPHPPTQNHRAARRPAHPAGRLERPGRLRRRHHDAGGGRRVAPRLGAAAAGWSSTRHSRARRAACASTRTSRWRRRRSRRRQCSPRPGTSCGASSSSNDCRPCPAWWASESPRRWPSSDTAW